MPIGGGCCPFILLTARTMATLPTRRVTIKITPTEHPASCLSSWLRVMPSVTQRGYSFDSIQVSSDALCPVFDGFPITKVAFGSSNSLCHHPFSERQFAVVDGSKENLLIMASDCLLELSYLLGLLLGVGNIGSERTTAEQPHRVSG